MIGKEYKLPEDVQKSLLSSMAKMRAHRDTIKELSLAAYEIRGQVWKIIKTCVPEMEEEVFEYEYDDDKGVIRCKGPGLRG